MRVSLRPCRLPGIVHSQSCRRLNPKVSRKTQADQTVIIKDQESVQTGLPHQDDYMAEPQQGQLCAEEDVE